ncbi:MAG TPA: cytochrome c oxidase assembly protein [Phenylobacterium sp.]|nr:cytochrome c oxidase assembly protein [Phenylobacterium sp.]
MSWVVAASPLALVVAAHPALAQSGEKITGHAAWSIWPITPEILILTVLAAAIYIAGFARRRRVAPPVSIGRHVMFFAGLATIFAALQSPIAFIADHLFSAHQIQHLLVRMVGPMLLALASPAELMSAGLPPFLRRNVLAPIISSRRLRAVMDFVMRPLVVTVLFVAALYVWEIPRLHDFALLNEPAHALMHITMLLAGLAFWWRIFDRRAPVSPFDLDEDQPWWRLFGPASPYGLPYGVRLMLLWIVALSNIILGAFTALKPTELYAAYDKVGRLYGVGAMQDEQIGGVLIWLPSSVMCLLAMLVIVQWMALNEVRLEQKLRGAPHSNSAALLHPTTAAELIARARPKNRAMALGFSIVVLSVFVATILIGVSANPSRVIGGRRSAAAFRFAHLERPASPTAARSGSPASTSEASSARPSDRAGPL